VFGDGDLIVRRSDLPSKCLFDFSNVGPIDTDESILLRTNLFIPHLNATNWYLTVVNRGNIGAFGEIRVQSAFTGGMLTNCAGVMLSAVNFLPGGGASITFNSLPGEHYEVQASADLMQWGVITNVTATGYTTTVVDSGLTDLTAARFYRVRQHTP
jgi:hypothetical protein